MEMNKTIPCPLCGDLMAPLDTFCSRHWANLPRSMKEAINTHWVSLWVVDTEEDAEYNARHRQAYLEAYKAALAWLTCNDPKLLEKAGQSTMEMMEQE